jgi:phage portal protein BeeE
MSPLTAFMIDLNIDFAANRFNLDYFHKDMMPPTVLETPNKLSEPDKERMNAQWEQLHGGLDKKHGIGFATGGTKVIKLGYNQTESMFFEQKR